MTILKWDRRSSDEVIEEIKRSFNDDLPVVLPTDTLYGIAAPAVNRRCLEAVFRMKERPSKLTLPLAVGNLPMVDEIAVIHRWQKDTLRRGLPGPVTFVLED